MTDISVPDSSTVTQRQLPWGWSTARLGDVTAERVPQNGPTHGGTFTYIDISSVDNQNKKIREPKILEVSQAPSRARQNIEADDVLVSMTRPNLNAVALVPDSLAGAVGSTGFHVLRPVGVEPKWLFAAVQSPDFIAAMAGLVQGALYPAVRPRDIQQYEIPIPPVAEQRRIVAEIETQFTRLDAAVAALERARANLKRYRESVLAKAVSPSSCSESPPCRWKSIAIGDAAEDVRYGTSAKTSNIQQGIPVLRMGNIQNGRLVTSDLKYLPHDHPEFPALLLEPGDLLFNRTNSAELVGKCAVYRGSTGAYSFASYLIRARFKQEYVPEFVSYFINSSHGRQWIKSVVNQQVGQANVNGTKLKNLTVLMPSFEEQQQIVKEVESRLSVIEELGTNITANLKRAERLRQSILRKAFAGQLLPQDPDDVPASVLLERIRVERNLSTPNSPRSKSRRKEGQHALR